MNLRNRDENLLLTIFRNDVNAPGWLKRTLFPTRQGRVLNLTTVFSVCAAGHLQTWRSGTTAEGFTAQSIIWLLGILSAFQAGLRGCLPSEEKEIQDKDPLSLIHI